MGSAVIRLTARCAQLGIWISGFSIVAMMCLITVGTVSRAVFGLAITGTDEVAGALVAISVYMALAYTFLEDGLIRVQLLRTRLPERFRRHFERFLVAVATVYAIVLVAYFWRFAWISVQRRVEWVGVLPMPVSPWHIAMALGATFFLLVLVVHLLRSNREGELAPKAPSSAESRAPMAQHPNER